MVRSKSKELTMLVSNDKFGLGRMSMLRPEVNRIPDECVVCPICPIGDHCICGLIGQQVCNAPVCQHGMCFQVMYQPALSVSE
jgi:hypothetical protein